MATRRSNKCTPLWREAHLEVKSVENSVFFEPILMDLVKLVQLVTFVALVPKRPTQGL